MPKHIPEEGSFSEHNRADGYTFRYYNPHSPFQRLIHGAMERKQLSLRAFSKLIDVSPSTVWVWLHNESGYPAGRKFESDTHLPRIANHLGIPQKEIERAIDASRLRYSDRVIPTPLPTNSALDDLIEFLEAGDSTYLRRSRVLSLAKRLRDGAAIEAEKSRAPDSKPSRPKTGGKPKGKKNPPRP